MNAWPQSLRLQRLWGEHIFQGVWVDRALIAVVSTKSKRSYDQRSKQSEERKIPRDHPLRSKNNLDQKDFGANKRCSHQKQGSKARSSLKYPQNI